MSLLMTVRNGERYIAEALTSVLEQTQPPREIIVVDDGSEDGTAAAVEAFGSAVRLHRQPPAGLAAGLNGAFALASCPFIAYLDSDDIWSAESLELRMARLAHDPAAGAAAGLTQQFVSPELDPDAVRLLRFDGSPLRARLFGAFLFRREAVEVAGPLDETLPLMSQGDWLASAQHSGMALSWIDEVVLRRRLHDANTTARRRELMERSMLEVARRQLARHRQQP